jgi:hypothetical protein
VAASGPSLTQEQVDYVKGRARVVAVNDAVYLAPWADVLYAADEKWWLHHMKNLSHFVGLMVCATKNSKLHGVNVIGASLDPPGQGFANPQYIRGGNSGASAMHLAFHLGAGSIYLLGCDCKDGLKGRHFFGEHPAQLNRGSNYGTFAAHFKIIGAEIEKRGVKVVNCSPDSALSWFPKIPLHEVL